MLVCSWKERQKESCDPLEMVRMSKNPPWLMLPRGKAREKAFLLFLPHHVQADVGPFKLLLPCPQTSHLGTFH